MTFKTALVGLSIGAISALGSFAFTRQTATPPIAYVSIQRILAESAVGKAQGAKLRTMQQEKAADLRSKQQALEATRQQLGQPADAATRASLQQRELQQRADLERASTQAQADLVTLNNQVEQSMHASVRAALDALLAGKDTQVVLGAETSIVWSRPGLDLTGAVLAKLAETAGPR